MHNLFILFLAFILSPFTLFAIENPGVALKNTGINPILGNKINLALPFTSASGTTTPLNQIMNSNIPSIIVPVYYQCPRLCGLVLNGVTKLVSELSLKLGNEYQVITVSFDSSEQSTLASERAENYLNTISSSPEQKASWHFLVGKDESVSPLMRDLGFGYFKDGKDFSHGAGIFLLTPEGEISQYFTGIDFPAWDVKLALVEASQGKIGSPLDHILLFCFRFDPTKGKYTWAAFNIMRVGGVITLIALASLVVYLFRREKILK